MALLNCMGEGKQDNVVQPLYAGNKKIQGFLLVECIGYLCTLLKPYAKHNDIILITKIDIENQVSMPFIIITQTHDKSGICVVWIWLYAIPIHLYPDKIPQFSKSTRRHTFEMQSLGIIITIFWIVEIRLYILKGNLQTPLLLIKHQLESAQKSPLIVCDMVGDMNVRQGIFTKNQIFDYVLWNVV